MVVIGGCDFAKWGWEGTSIVFRSNPVLEIRFNLNLMCIFVQVARYSYLDSFCYGKGQKMHYVGLSCPLPSLLHS